MHLEIKKYINILIVFKVNCQRLSANVNIYSNVEENLDLAQSLQAINNVILGHSWFGENAYRAPDAAKPILYASACLEVVLENSEKGRAIFNQIVEVWGKPGVYAVYEKVMSNVPDEEKEKEADQAKLTALIQTKENISKMSDYEARLK